MGDTLQSLRTDKQGQVRNQRSNSSDFGFIVDLTIIVVSYLYIYTHICIGLTWFAGKTFTMQGDGKERSGQAGIIQLATSDLFRFMRQGDAASREFIVKVSYFELYNEKIRDLLSEDTEAAGSSNGGRLDRRNTSGSSSIEEDVKIRTNADGEIVMNIVQHEVSTVDEVLELLVRGNAHRVTASTDMNAHSSRSHAVFRLTVESRATTIEPDLYDTSAREVLRVADFNLVDLAGSESAKLANANTVGRQREGAKINTR
jgi:hypothetical protein